MLGNEVDERESSCSRSNLFEYHQRSSPTLISFVPFRDILNLRIGPRVFQLVYQSREKHIFKVILIRDIVGPNQSLGTITPELIFHHIDIPSQDRNLLIGRVRQDVWFPR